MNTRSATHRVAASLEAAPAPAARPARRAPARPSRRPAAARPQPGGWPARSPAAPTAGPAPRPRPAAGSRAPPPRRPLPRGRLLRFQEPADGGDQPGQRFPVDQVCPAEVVDHLGDRAAGPRVPLVVRQLQVRHHGAVFVPPPRLSQVHAYKSSNPGRPAPATRRRSCAYSFPPLRHPRASLTRRNSSDQARKCLRAAEVRQTGHL